LDLWDTTTNQQISSSASVVLPVRDNKVSTGNTLQNSSKCNMSFGYS